MTEMLRLFERPEIRNPMAVRDLEELWTTTHPSIPPILTTRRIEQRRPPLPPLRT